MPQGIKLFRHKKYAKMLVNPPHVPFHKPSASKKQRHFVLLDRGMINVFAKSNTKPLRFRFGSANFFYCAPVFLIHLALGIDNRT